MKLRQMHNLLKDDVKMQIEEAIREMKEKEEQEFEKKQLSWKQKAMGVVLPTESELAEA